MTPEETFGQFVGLGMAWRILEARLEASVSTSLMKVQETPDLWPKESTRAGMPVTCHDYVEPMQCCRLTLSWFIALVCGCRRTQRDTHLKVAGFHSPIPGCFDRPLT